MIWCLVQTCHLISCVVSPNNTNEGGRMLVKLQRLPGPVNEEQAELEFKPL